MRPFRDKKVVWPHWIMLLLVFIKAVSLVLVAMKYRILELYGTDIINGWAISYYIFLLYAGQNSHVSTDSLQFAWWFDGGDDRPDRVWMEARQANEPL